jgi:hypothetical protein
MNTILVSILLAVALSAPQVAPAAGKRGKHPEITAYRSKTCGCCGKWVDHLRAAGFKVTVHVVDSVDNAPGRDRVPTELRSCHVARVTRYVIEGHVPADVIKDFLHKGAELEGLAVPGMPAGSPGMESTTPQPYDVVTWDRTGKQRVFARR